MKNDLEVGLVTISKMGRYNGYLIKFKYIFMSMALIIIPLCALIVAFIGSRYTQGGINWYEHIRKPDWTPSGKMIRAVWVMLFSLAGISALFAWQSIDGVDRLFVLGLYLANALLTLLWSYIFFREHQMGIAVFEAGALSFSALAIILAVWQASYIAALLLVPYLVWVSFATYLTHRVWKLNTNWKWSSI